MLWFKTMRPIKLNSVHHVPCLKKNLHSVGNALDLGMYILLDSSDVKFLRNVEMMKEAVVVIGDQVDDIYVI